MQLFRCCLLAAFVSFSLSLGCQGGRFTLLDPASRSLARHSAESGSKAAARADDNIADRAFRNALRFDSKNAEAHAGLARLAIRRGDETAAVDHYRKAIRCAPGNGTYAVEFADLLNRIALTSLDRRHMGDAALRAYRYARSLIRYDGDLAFRHALCARDLGEMREAVACMIDAVALSPKSAEFQLELAETYEMIGDVRSAGRARTAARQLETVTQGEEIAASEDDPQLP